MNAYLENVETIVEYSAAKAPCNGYPNRIISPPEPGPCCVTRMNVIGEIHMDSGGPYVYKQCTVCGYTVRHFFPAPAAGSEDETN